MKCTTCGAEIPENVKFCTVCGTAVTSITPPAPAQQVPVQPAPVRTAPVHTALVRTAPVTLAPETKLLGPWAYIGLQLLFSIPLVGFILLIVFSLDNSNLNRRNYARSYWCALVVGLVLTILVVILLAVTGAGAAILAEMG